ncbi:MAG: ABC transporter substrate-binding protein [Glaciecola sp.]|nr:ABC transporter substrate-binding protein [Glaciecola sp.]MDG1814808.1 ABC transporter substrate-binding protein [Glaciecola sp.]MDG2098953.1 ABC transporter substrate-binding protein [Glaciecola sp.]
MKYQCAIYNKIQCFMLNVLVLLFGIASANINAADINVNIYHISHDDITSYAVNPLLKAPDNAGIAGAALGIADSNTTGKFLGQHFTLRTIHLDDISDNVNSSIDWPALLPQTGLLLADLASPYLQQLLTYNASLSEPHLIINVSNRDNSLRQTQCNTMLFHTTPSHAQVTDALGQWLLSKRLNRIFLIDGDTPEDASWVDSFERTAKRYKLKIETTKQWTFATDLRRTVSLDIPLFTQTARPYDVVVVADTHQRFGQYIPYNTYYPRPVIGTAGLVADTWHPSIEQWGAKQLQNRFYDQHARSMQHQDYDAYVAVRAIAYAVQQTQSLNATPLALFLRSDAFQLAAYKGRKLNFRDYNGQLRMPMELTHPLGLVSRAPQEGFMHPITDLDTLGFDRREVCQE